MKTPHIHAAVIKAWADGATIEYRGTKLEDWRPFSVCAPSWFPELQYRVKPEPKPDWIEIRDLTYNSDFGCIILNGRDNPNIQFVFDGETGRLKDAQVLVSSGE